MRAMNRIAAAAMFALAATGPFCTGTAQGAVLEFKTTMLGSNEVPPNSSPAIGFARVDLNDATGLLTVNLSFSNLLATASAAHIHCCTTPGNNAPVVLPFSAADGFPFGATSGSFSHTYDLATALNGISVPAFIAGLESGEAYTNVHNMMFPGGEIRGFLAAAPEPSSIALLGFSLAAVAGFRRRARSA
jgi:hypothetical protein